MLYTIVFQHKRSVITRLNNTPPCLHMSWKGTLNFFHAFISTMSLAPMFPNAHRHIPRLYTLYQGINCCKAHLPAPLLPDLVASEITKVSRPKPGGVAGTTDDGGG